MPAGEPLSARDQDSDLKGWLRPRGLDVIRIPAGRDDNGVRTLPWGVCIACGTTNRDTHHAVVWDAGWWEESVDDGEMLHDPHPSRDGLEEVEYFKCFVVREPLRLGLRGGLL